MLLGVVVLAGCQFAVPALGPDEGVTGGGADLAAVDLAGADFAIAPGVDLAGTVDLAVPPDFARLPDLTPVAGNLVVSCEVRVDTVNLTNEGLTDWMHWGLNNALSINEKQGHSALGNFDAHGASLAQHTVNGSTLSWNDGTPTASVAATTSSTSVGGVGTHMTFTVASDPTPDTLKVYVGGHRAEGTLTVTISDGSATAPAQVLNAGAGADDWSGVCTVTFNASSGGQSLTVDWAESRDQGGGSEWLSLQAATVQ
jgi:hypothetical protein